MVIRVEPKVMKIQRERGLTGIIGAAGQLINSVESMVTEPAKNIPFVSKAIDPFVKITNGMLSGIGGVARKVVLPIDQALGTMTSEFGYYRIS